MDDLRELQENEVTVLKSIYLNECVDVREEVAAGKSNKRQQNNDYPTLRITLHPQNSDSQVNREQYVQIDLKVKMTPGYPNELENIFIQINILI